MLILRLVARLLGWAELQELLQAAGTELHGGGALLAGRHHHRTAGTEHLLAAQHGAPGLAHHGDGLELGLPQLSPWPELRGGGEGDPHQARPHPVPGFQLHLDGLYWKNRYFFGLHQLPRPSSHLLASFSFLFLGSLCLFLVMYRSDVFVENTLVLEHLPTKVALDLLSSVKDHVQWHRTLLHLLAADRADHLRHGVVLEVKVQSFLRDELLAALGVLAHKVLHRLAVRQHVLLK